MHGNWEELVLPGSDVTTRLISMWQRWDALWYRDMYALYALASVALLMGRQMWFSPLMSVGRYVPVIFRAS